MANDTLTKIVEIELNANKAVNELVRYSQAIEDSKNKEKEAIAEFGKASKEYEVQRQKTEALKKEKQVLNRQIQNDIKILTDERTSLKGMRAELSNLNKQYDRLNKTQRENDKIGGNLQRRIQSLTKEIKAAEYETERYQRNVGNYTNSILSAIGVNNELGKTIITNTTTIKGTASVVVQSVKSMNTAFLSLLSNPAFVAIAGIVGAGIAFKWWADYNDGISEATRLTKEFTGYNGQQLTELRSSIMATSEVMDKDYNDVLKTADSLMAHFHLTGAEAMEVINKGFAAGADLNGNMLQLLQDNAAAFHDAGLSAAEMMAIITQTRSGIFGEDGLAAINKASQQIKLMSAQTRKALQGIGIDADKLQDDLVNKNGSTFDAIKQIAGAIKELPDNSQEAAEAMRYVFGRVGLAASQEMIESLKEMNTNLDDVLKQTGDYGQLLLEQIDTQGKVENSAAELFAVENGGWEAVKMKCEIYWNYALNALLSYWNMGKKFWKYVIQGVGNFVIKINAGISSAFSMFTFAHNQVKKLGTAFVGLGDIIANAITGKFEEARNAWGKLKDLAASVGTDYQKAIAGARNQYNTSTSENMGALDAWLWDKGDFTKPAEVEPDKPDKPTKPTKPTANTSGSGNTGTTTKSGKDPRLALAEKLAKAAEQMQANLLRQAAADNGAAIDAYYNQQLQALEKEYAGLGKMTEEEAKQYQLLVDNIERQREDAKDKYIQSLTEAARSEAGELLQARLAVVEKGSEEERLIRLTQLDLQYEAEREKYAENAEMLQALEENYNQNRYAIEKEYADKIAEIQEQRVLAVSSMFGSLSTLMDAFGEKSRAAAVASKVLGFAEIAIANGVAIAKGVKDAMAVPFPANLGAIATTIAAITSTIVKATSLLNSAKFATGGYVSGAGTSTSDSIPARLSNGESVLNANSTAMFGSLLSSLNQLGGGAPIQANASAQSVQGEEMLARAFQRGAASLPAPVVGVREFTKVNERVAIIKDSAKL